MFAQATNYLIVHIYGCYTSHLDVIAAVASPIIIWLNKRHQDALGIPNFGLDQVLGRPQPTSYALTDVGMLLPCTLMYYGERKKGWCKVWVLNSPLFLCAVFEKDSTAYIFRFGTALRWGFCFFKSPFRKGVFLHLSIGNVQFSQL